jgi:hypothetical protein
MLALVSKLTTSGSMLVSISEVESTAMADDKPSNLVGVERPAMVGEEAGESVDPDPHGRRQLTRFNPCNAHA